MYWHFRSELAKLGQEIEQLWAPELRGAKDEATKKHLRIARVLSLIFIDLQFFSLKL